MTTTERAIFRMRDETMRCIAKQQIENGERHADQYVAGMLLGCIEHLTATRGSRQAYRMISELADGIIEAELPQGK